MFGQALSRLARDRRDQVFGALVFAVCFSIFLAAPVQQALDSRYSMLLSENLIRHHDFALERYHLRAPDYRIQTAGEHQYYSFPPGTSILSVPFVAVMHLGGVSAVSRDGSYSVTGELRLDAALAALLMAAFASLVYVTSRQLLPIPWSLGVTFVAAFGTQVFSTMSRSMWSDTWGTLLTGGACFWLLRSASRRGGGSLLWLATLEAVAYIVRPTNSIVLAGTAFYIALTRPKDAWQFAATVAGWLGLLCWYSWRHFHKLLPSYYVASRLQFASPLPSIFGNLISPSRGLLVYVPAVIAIGLLLARYWPAVRFRSLANLAGFVMLGHFFVLAGFGHWWGGYSYGARLTASLVPWIVVLAILAIDAVRVDGRWSYRRPSDIVFASATGILCAMSVAINGIGAFFEEAETWNAVPDIDRSPSRLWSWRRPQFLAPFVEPEGPWLPLPVDGLHIGTAESDGYCGLGWSFGEGEFRWTVGRGGSAVRFLLPAAKPGLLELDLSPYLAAHKMSEQRLLVSVNDHDIGSLILRDPSVAKYSFAVPADAQKKENWLCLRTPDATSPSSVERSGDRRRLGVAVRVIRWRVDPG